MDNGAYAMTDPGVVDFKVVHGNVTINARISREALEDHFGAGTKPETWVKAYRANSAQIHEMVIARHQMNPGVGVLLRTQDF